MSDFFSYIILSFSGFDLTVKKVILALFLTFGAPVIFFLFKRFILKNYFKRRKYDEGRRFAVTSLAKYLYYFIFFLLALQILGLKLSLLLGAGAALLVGAGIGLQQTFNDFASGVILLMEGTVQKGDWIKVGDMEGTVLRIGLRTSQVQTRRNIDVIVPNSKITVDNVINFSHNTKNVRYSVTVSVAYGSDVKKVKEILLNCGSRHNLVMSKPAPFVRFNDFGESSLNFELLFWCDDYFNVEDVRSDLRFMIDSEFRTHHIVIPFPQRDLHIKQFTPIQIEHTNNTAEPNNENLSK